MEPRDEHDTNVHVKLTSSDGNDDFMRCNQVVVVGGVVGVVGVAVDYVVEFGLEICGTSSCCGLGCCFVMSAWWGQDYEGIGIYTNTSWPTLS